MFHALITIAIDAAIAIPDAYLFDFQKSLIGYHIRQNNDLLVLAKPAWLQAFVWLEILFQLPLFIIAPVALWRDVKSLYPIMLIYGIEASVTTYACLAETLYLELSQPAKMTLFFVYLPTCVLPLFIAIDYYRRILTWIPNKKTIKAD